MKKMLIIALCFVIVIFGTLLSMKYFFNNKPRKHQYTSYSMVFTQELEIQKPYTIKDSYLAIELLQINKDENKCLLAISNSFTSQKTQFWAELDKPFPEASNLKNPNLIKVTKIEEKTISL